ncbi:hypothetical protein ACS4N0_09110 [Levilactobacillus zymae]|uniref:hypothetical protein n=1 Tax=Levilactobacillus zymae TaxID=267363 RepID=UPI003FCC4701
MKVIQYNLTGEVIKRYSSDFNQFEDYPVGEKVRITTTSGQKYVGFWQTFFTTYFPEQIQIFRYNLDEKSSKLMGFDDTLIFIPVRDIAKIEVILYSSPRWGGRPTNEFSFSQPIKNDLPKSH